MIDLERCVQCGRDLRMIDVHGHEQCVHCGYVAATCCEGSQRHGQLPCEEATNN